LIHDELVEARSHDCKAQIARQQIAFDDSYIAPATLPVHILDDFQVEPRNTM
jgi:hypothetical protein